MEKSEYEQITQKQIEAIKERAIALWGEKWLPQLVREYARVTGSNERTKFAQIQRYFQGEHTPNLDTMNAILLAVNCRFQLACYTAPEIKEF